MHYTGVGVAAVSISLAATGILILLRPDQAITLLVYLPGIAIVEALFGLWGGVAAVLLSVAGSATIRTWFLANPLQAPVGFYATWEEEIILLVVGLFVVALMELRRRSGARAATGAHQLAAVLENVADAVVVFDRRLRVASMNPAARAMFNRPGGPITGFTVEQLRQRFSFTSERGAPAAELEDAFREGQPIHEEGTVLDRDDNRRIHVLLSAAPWRNADNRIEGMLVMLTDVTTLKEMQVRALDNARHLALAQMISGLTHDFNHVLDIVRRANAVLTLQENAAVEERRKYRDMIDRAARDGGAIIRRLRDYLAGGTDVTGQVDLAAAAREAVALTRPLWGTRPEVEMIEAIEPVPLVRGNLDDLRRVLTNLIFNAIEAIDARDGLDPPRGRVTVRTAAAPGVVTASVEDNGAGIPLAVQKRLFQPHVTTKPRGMGVGLFGAQKIVLAHGGKLEFTSTPGQGTCFTVELPRLVATLEGCNAGSAGKPGKMVPQKGLEPPLPCENVDLNHARLPVPPLRHVS